MSPTNEQRDDAPPIDPKSELSLAELCARARATAQELLAAQREEAGLVIALGADLHRIAELMGVRPEDVASFQAFTQELGLSSGEPDLYMRARRLPQEKLAGKRISAGKLEFIADAPEWLRAALIDVVGWPCLYSLTQFGLLGFRHFVHLLPYSDIPESYKPWCQQQAELIPAWDWADWFYNAKDDYLLFKAELDRLEAAGMQRGAVGAAEDHVRAIRAARAQAAAEQAKKDAAKKPPTRRKAPRPRPSG